MLCQHHLERIVLPVDIVVQVPYPYCSSDRGPIARNASNALLREFEVLVKHMKCGECIYYKIIAVCAVYRTNDIVIVI